MTIQQVLIQTTARLATRLPETARAEAEWILCALLNIPRIELYLRAEEQFPGDAESHVEEIVTARLVDHPLQYVVGCAEFYGRRFICDPRALIPRPETEILAETTLVYLNSTFPPQPNVHPLVWDIGTGCGNIAVTLAVERPDVWVLATDIERDALRLARENCLLHRVEDRVILAAAPLCDPVVPRQCFAAIISNPPYVSEKAKPTLPADVRNYEPETALFAADGGLAILRQIIACAKDYLLPGGFLALEIGFDQADIVRGLLSTDPAYAGIKVTRDLAGHDRVAGAVRT